MQLNNFFFFPEVENLPICEDLVKFGPCLNVLRFEMPCMDSDLCDLLVCYKLGLNIDLMWTIWVQL